METSASKQLFDFIDNITAENVTNPGILGALSRQVGALIRTGDVPEVVRLAVALERVRNSFSSVDNPNPALAALFDAALEASNVNLVRHADWSQRVQDGGFARTIP